MCRVQGNVILTDHKYEILTLLRSHRDDDKGRSTMARHPYPMHAIRLREPLALPTLTTALAAAAAGDAAAAANGAAAGGGGGGSALNNAAGGLQQEQEGEGEQEDGLEGSDSEAETAAAEGQQQGAAGSKTANGTNPAPAGKGGKQAATGGKKGWAKAGKATAGPVLKSIVADLVPYGPAVAEHCCHLAGLSPQHPLASQPLSEDQILALHKGVQQFEAWLAGLDQGDQAEGFITAVPTAASKAKQQQQQQGGDCAGEKEKGPGEGEKVGLVYQEYNPLRLQGGKGAGGEVLTYSCFDDALDEYYGKVRNLQGQGLQKRWK